MKKTLLFFLGYAVLMVSLIFSGIYFSNANLSSTNPIIQQNKSDTEKSIKDFKEAFKTSETVVKKPIKEDKWKPSSTFLIIAISIASVIDLVIILLFVKYENRKKELAKQGIIQKNRITDSNWFWWVIGLGVLKKTENQLKVNWKLFISYSLLLLGVKVIIGIRE
ncbi:MAG: hypothetical protein K0Q87_2105 [Neobacillus sp.]|jgi:hypothetical protein|nr:hypothetical protein [Neobacillus sp.]